MMNLSKFGWTKIGLWVGIAALPLWSLSGCGGGGGVSVPPPVNLGTPTPAPPVTPSPSATPTLPGTNPGQTVFTPNYVAAIENALHWSSYPIRVYFVPNSNLNATRRNIAVTGFNQWVSTTQNRVRYNVVTDAAQADITVTFSAFSGGAGDELGVSFLTFEERTNRLISVEMNIGITGDDREDIQTAAHEFGHSIGIGGHSDSPADLMFPSGNSAGCSCITPRDLNTLLTIYSGQFPQNSNARRLPSGPTRTIVIH